MSIVTLLEPNVNNFNHCSNRKTSPLNSSVKREPIHLTEEDFRESLRNTWLPDIDSSSIHLDNDIKVENSSRIIENLEIKLNNHGTSPVLNSVHNEMFACKKCKKKFGDNLTLQEHEKSCTVMKSGFPCLTCNKIFSTRSRLQNHTRIHTGVKPFVCSVCTKAFADRSAFIKHERIHFRLKEERIECNICGGLFSDSWGLKKHQLTHSGERPYECPVCHKTFRTSSTLVVHKRIHTGEKPYPCSLCDKRFAVKTHLVTHTRTHSGERPYECQTCGRTFSDRSSWRRHSRRHDNETTEASQPPKKVNLNENRVSAIESLQNFVSEQYKPVAKPEIPVAETDYFNANGVSFPPPRPFFEDFHRFIIEQQVIDSRVLNKTDLLTKNASQNNNPSSKYSKPIDISSSNPFFKHFHKTFTDDRNTLSHQEKTNTFPIQIDNKLERIKPNYSNNYLLPYHEKGTFENCNFNDTVVRQENHIQNNYFLHSHNSGFPLNSPGVPSSSNSNVKVPEALSVKDRTVSNSTATYTSSPSCTILDNQPINVSNKNIFLGALNIKYF